MKASRKSVDARIEDVKLTPAKLMAAISIVVLCGCGSKPESEADKLVAARNLWHGNGFGRNYSYTFSKNCNSRPGKPNISVIDGVARSLDENGNTQARSAGAEIYTIEDLMERIAALIDEKRAGATDFEVVYNAEYGYPVYLRVDPGSGAMDSRYEICILNLVFTGA